MAKAGVRTTALSRYALLESTGVHVDGAGAAPQEVVVRFGESTLTLQDFDDTPVAHWALAGLRRLDGSGPEELRLAPDMDGEERLVIRDPQMIEAIEAVCAELDRPAAPRRRPARLLAAAALALAVVALAGGLAVVLPGATGRLADLTPEAQAARLGDQVGALAVERLAPGAERCAAREGRAALDRLAARLLRETDAELPLRLRVVGHPAPHLLAAPGGLVILTSGLIEAARTPEEVAALLAHQIGHVAARDPLSSALAAAGPLAALGVVLGRDPGPGPAREMARSVLAPRYDAAAERAADAFAHELLARAGLPAGALARILERLQAEPGGMTPLRAHFADGPGLEARIAAARAADTVSGAPFAPALDDADWIALRQICE